MSTELHLGRCSPSSPYVVGQAHIQFYSAHLQFVGKRWKQALTQLHTCTCGWTNTRKTGLRLTKCRGLPEVWLQPDMLPAARRTGSSVRTCGPLQHRALSCRRLLPSLKLPLSVWRGIVLHRRHLVLISHDALQPGIDCSHVFVFTHDILVGFRVLFLCCAGSTSSDFHPASQYSRTG